MTKDCKVCLTPHDEEIHAATLRVHLWFRDRVKTHLSETSLDPAASDGEKLEAEQLTAA